MSEKRRYIKKRHIFLLLSVFALLFAAGGAFYYINTRETIREEQGEELNAIAQLKAQQIENWVKERKSETEYFSTTDEIIENIARLTSDPLNQEAYKKLYSSLSSIQKNHHYDDILIINKERQVIFSLNNADDENNHHFTECLDSTFNHNHMVFSDLYYCDNHKKIHLDFIAPVSVSPSRSEPTAALVMRINPGDYLYPMIESWPIPSKTCEAYLVRIEGNDIIVLSNLRHRINSALNFRTPIKNKELFMDKKTLQPLKNNAIVDREDYRGEEVLTQILPIKNTQWILTAKIDKSEAFADLNYRGSLILTTVVLLILLLGSGLAWIYNVRQKQIFEDLINSREKLNEKEEEFRTALYSIGDGVISTDHLGIIRRMNFIAENLTGWKEKEAVGKNLSEVFRIINEDSRQNVESPVENVLREGIIIGLANHTLLISRDGKEIPIADSGAPLKNNQGKITGVILVFRDQIAEREAENRLRMSEAHYRLLFESNPQPMWVYDVESLQFLAVNDYAIAKYGYSREEFLSKTIFDIRPQEDFDILRNNLAIAKEKIQYSGIWKHKYKNGTVIQVEISSQSIRYNHRDARLVVVHDITERVKIEKTLRDREELLTETGRIAKVGGWEFDAKTKKGTWSEEVARIHDLDPKEKSSVDLGLQFYVNDSKTKFEKAIKEAIELKKPYDLELEMVTARNIHKWVRTIGQPVVENGSVVKIKGAFQDITESVIIKKELTESEERYRSIFNNHHTVMLLIDPETGRIMDANPAACHFYGYPYDDILAKRIFDIDNASTDDIRNNILTVQRTGLKQFIVQHKLANNELKNVEIFSGKIFIKKKELIYTIVHDISERTKAEKELKKLSEAIRQSPASIVITNAQGTIEYVNPMFSTMTGYTPDEAIGKKPSLVKSGVMSNEFYKNLWDTILRGDIWHGEMINKRKNGELLWVDKSISPITNNMGEITNFVSIGEDITDKKKQEGELIKAKEKAEENDRLKTAFLANMSHEIRTPMNGILGFAELLKDTKLSGEEQKEYIGIIEQSGQRMLNIINDIIDISKIEAGQMELKMEETEINLLLHHLYTFFRPEVSHKGLLLSLSLGSKQDEGPVFSTDRTKLSQVISNLIKNSIKFTNTGSIEFGYTQNEDKIEFFVKDTGTGIPAKQHEKIFERFIQGDTSLSRNYEGAGLGLAISKAYVEMLGGKIWLKSEEGKGTTFYFNLDVPDLKTGDQPNPSVTREDHPELRNQLHILVVEDDEYSMKFLTKILNNLKTKLYFAQNGEEALRIVKSIPLLDLVLMDLKMPVMDGYEATRQIKQIRPKLPVIAQTAYAFSDDERKAKLSGCDDFIAKPIRREQLLEIIKRQLPQGRKTKDILT